MARRVTSSMWYAAWRVPFKLEGMSHWPYELEQNAYSVPSAGMRHGRQSVMATCTIPHQMQCCPVHDGTQCRPARPCNMAHGTHGHWEEAAQDDSCR